jgi:hypothetical protein
MSEFTIRQAEQSDCEGIARVHVDSWREAYAGIVPDEYLASLSIERRKSMWEKILSQSDDFTLVAEVNDEIVGFVNTPMAIVQF